jgi:hypothetical protein
MDRTTRALLGRAILCLVLLSGQQVALAHPITHLFAAGSEPAATDSAAPSGAPAGSSELCSFHSSLSAVLGAVAQAAASFVPPAVVDVAYPAPAWRAIPLAPPPSASRDPPLFS